MIQSIFYIIIWFITFTTGLPVSLDDNNGNSLVQSLTGEYLVNDMIIPPEPRGVAAIPVNYYRWENNTVPYEMTSTILPQHQTLIVEQMRAMENMTRVNGVDCITFRPKVASDTYHIIVQNGSGCSATLGYNRGYNGNRYLNLLYGPPYTCMISGIIQHELLHVLGFYHEQSRPDRDQYVSIQWANIQPSSQFNFDIYNYTDVDTQQTPYDYGSVMHYEKNAFAINSSAPTIIPTQNATAFIGQRIKMSPIDILEVQKYYGCIPTSTTSTIASSSSSSSSSGSSTSSSSGSSTSSSGGSSTSSSGGSSNASAGTTGSTAPTTIELATSTGQRRIVYHFMTYLLFSCLMIYIH